MRKKRRKGEKKTIRKNKKMTIINKPKGSTGRKRERELSVK